MAVRGRVVRSRMFAPTAMRRMSGHVLAHPAAGVPWRDSPSLARFVALSLLLHLLLLVVIRESDWVGSSFPVTSWITGLNVALRPPAPDTTVTSEPSSQASDQNTSLPRLATRTEDAAAALPRPRVDARPAEPANVDVGELPAVASPRPARAADTPAHFLAPAEGLDAPALPLGHLEAAPRIDREFAPLAKVAPPRALPPAAAPPLQRIDPPREIDRAFAPVVKLTPPRELPPVDTPLSRLEPPPTVERALVPLPKVERPRALATDAAPLQPLDAAPVLKRAPPPLPKPEIPSELAAGALPRPLEPVPVVKALVTQPKTLRPSELSAAETSLTRLDAPALDRALAPLPKAETPQELTTATDAPLSRLEAPPSVDRQIAPLPKAETPGELAAATAAPLSRIASPPGIDRAFTPATALAPPPDLPARGALPLARIEGAATVDRSFAAQPGFVEAPGTAAAPQNGSPSAGEVSRGGAGAGPGPDRLFAPRLEATPPRDTTTPDGAPRLDLDATRRLAREINREPVPASRGRALIMTSPPPETESRLGRAIAKAAQPDCRDAFAGLGLLALPILIAEAITDTGCRW
jgi:hypothetical protein